MPIIHGLHKHPLYNVYHNMMKRCYKKYSQEYHNYGARGIKVCKQWQSFLPFYKWAMESGYKKGLYLDRINSSSNYLPKNCRWVTRSISCSNRRKIYPIQKIRDLRKAGMKTKEIMAIVGCSKTWVNMILRVPTIKD